MKPHVGQAIGADNSRRAQKSSGVRAPRLHQAVAGLLSLIAVSLCVAAPLQRNLGDGLVYFRIHALPADLPADAAIVKHAAVIDVRYATGETDAAAVFGSWLRFHASRQDPLFILANTGTAPAILAVLRESKGSGLLTVGLAGHRFSPEIPVEGSATEEKRAYQALDDGATVASLIADHPEKQRNDEASLAKPAPSSTADDLPASEPAAPNPAPPVDLSLQRAVQLLRGLKALKTTA